MSHNIEIRVKHQKKSELLIRSKTGEWEEKRKRRRMRIEKRKRVSEMVWSDVEIHMLN